MGHVLEVARGGMQVTTVCFSVPVGLLVERPLDSSFRGGAEGRVRNYTLKSKIYLGNFEMGRQIS